MRHPRQAAADPGVQVVHAGRLHSQEDLTGSRDRLRQVGDLQDLDTAVPSDDDRLHAGVSCQTPLNLGDRFSV